MKKMMIMLTLAATAMTALSCTKDSPVKPAAKGTPVTLEIGFPDVDANPDMAPTKISNNGTIKKFKWDAGDQLQIFSYNWTNNILTEWDPFTTEAGGAWARFNGVLPAGYSAATHGDKFTIVSLANQDVSLTRTSTTDRYDLKFNIPANQDGTGIKYCLFGNATTTVPAFDPETNSFSGVSMRCYTALSVLNIVGGDVRSIKITVNHAKNQYYWVISKGDAQDVVYNCTNNGLSGGGAKVITISNNNEVLSGNVFFVSRQTNGGATQGYASMVFEFTNGEGKVCTKHVVLAKGTKEDGTADSYINLSTYNTLNNFGTVDLTNATFVDPS